MDSLALGLGQRNHRGHAKDQFMLRWDHEGSHHQYTLMVPTPLPKDGHHSCMHPVVAGTPGVLAHMGIGIVLINKGGYPLALKSIGFMVLVQLTTCVQCWCHVGAFVGLNLA